MKKNGLNSRFRSGSSGNLLKKMKLLIAFFFTGLLGVSASTYSQQTKLSLKFDEVTVKEAFKLIEKNTEFVFFYNEDYIDVNRKVSLNANDEKVESILNELLNGTQNTFKIYDRQIVILPPDTKESPVVIKLETNAEQKKEISGSVKDSKGLPLPGVSVVVKGTTTGIVTNADGKFRISVPADVKTLVFSFIGMKTQEIVIGNNATINVTLAEETVGIEEVVAVGYGTQKKTSLTSSVSAMNGKEIESLAVTNISNAIGGRMSGVIVKQASGEPGRDGSKIYIRGISTLGSNQPLIIVDGIPRDFNNLDQNSIESFTVLKDAAAVAPFGVAGANGVILITTKRGLSGKPTITYNGYIGFQNPTHLPDYCNSFEYATLKNIVAVNAGLPKLYTDDVLQKFKDGSDPDAYPPHFNQWDELVNKNALLQYHNIEVSGGSENIKYYTNLGYQYQKGMWATTNMNRYNLSMNLDIKATPTTNIAFSINGNKLSSTRPPSDQSANETSRIFALASYIHPGFSGPLFFSNGTPGNYVSAAIFGSGYHKTQTFQLYSNLSIEQDIPFISGLKLKGVVAYDPIFNHDKTWTTPVHMGKIDTSKDPYVISDVILGLTQATLNEQRDETYQLTYQASLNYSKTIGPHNINLSGIFEAKERNSASLGAFRQNYIVPIDEINMGSSASADMTTRGSSSGAKQVGLVYRINYNYKNKYLIEATGRYDGHYYFAPDKRWGFFPAFSGGWRVTEEKFLKDRIACLNNLKLRASYGEVGALAGSPFQYLSIYNVAGPGYVIGGKGVMIAAEGTQANPTITWERAKKTDIGLDISLWEGLFNIEADYFYEKRSNMLVSSDVTVPREYGIGLSQVNAGVMENRGIDFSANMNFKISGDLHISLSGSFTYAKNKLLQVFETSSTYDNPNRRLTGRPLGTYFGYQAVGYFQLADFDSNGKLNPGIVIQPWGVVMPGDIRYEDINGDGKINDNDIVPIGAPQIPQIIYGISPKIQYKNFVLDLFLQGTGMSESYFRDYEIWPFAQGRNAMTFNFDFWTPENPNARFPRITTAPTTNNTQTSSHWVANVNYLKLKTAMLSYNIPLRIIQKIKINNARVYLSGQNILTWTKQKYRDPELTDEYRLKYPTQKVISIGLNFNL